MRSTTILVSTVALVVAMCGSAVAGVIKDGEPRAAVADVTDDANLWASYCGKDAEVPEGARFLCFKSCDGPASYEANDLNRAVVYNNPTNNKEFVVVFNTDSSWARLYTDNYRVASSASRKFVTEVLNYDKKAAELLGSNKTGEGCIMVNIRPQGQEFDGLIKAYCPPYEVIEIGKEESQ
ncbi:uncharacterized protein SPSC_04676 [Sporisorium scitamineum]|uniref:Mig1 protein n=1 Tax=Sporisorium scitamineum TaxID=49012 RepID=A0A0F7SCN1_9BASI|nr:uncharacterized protein SPSC_04676 [Sporisorium scitamineum]CDW99145.1 hypothetical protein [Sporisorium scitamineum]